MDDTTDSVKPKTPETAEDSAGSLERIVRRLAWIPVWLLTNIFKPLLRENHPWKYQRLTLQSWCDRGTPIALQFSVFFWVQGVVLTFLIVRLLMW